ncbi:MAG TPA: class I SAM-dependent methyltransferase [Burkholderiales bacterium]|nr:class I SAM-dependent methyltransferase [Burkholderiales bacterium]
MSRLLAAAAVALSAFAAGASEDTQPAPFFTTPLEVVHRMLALAGTRAQDLVVDLGSGDGRIVIAAAEKFGARGLGIELDRALVAKSRENARQAGVADRVTFVQGDVLTADLSSATVVTVYLLPGLINRLQQRFLNELQPGTRIVSHAFAMTGWRADRSELLRISKPHPGQGDESRLFLWIVPADARGVWQAPGSRLRIHQNFQDVEVEGRLAGRDLAGARATLTGRTLAVEAGSLRFHGRVQGNIIAGELTSAETRQPLMLTR